MSHERMKKAEAELKAQIEALLARAKATDDGGGFDPAYNAQTAVDEAAHGMALNLRRMAVLSAG